MSADNLPRQIKFEDVRPGMVIERRKDEAAHRGRVHQIDGDIIVGTNGAWLWVPGNAYGGWSLWLIEDAPDPVDPDAEAIEAVAQRIHDQTCPIAFDWNDHVETAHEMWREDARALLAVLRETHDVTARAEQ